MARMSTGSVPLHAQRPQKQQQQPRQQQYQHKQQQKQKPHAQHSKSAVSSPGSNWKSAVQTRERQRRKPGHKRKQTKKASSDPRDSKLLHVVAASSSKQHNAKGGRAHNQNQRAFPRGLQRKSVAVTVAASPQPLTQLDTSTATTTAAPTSTSSLDDEIMAFARFVALTPQERAFRSRTFRDLESIICRAFPTATVQLYGSSSNGLETFRSDLDITVGNIALSDSLRTDVHNALAAQQANADSDADADAVSNDDDDDDYEDERYVAERSPVRAPPTPISSSNSVESPDDAPSFSLNIATPRGPHSSSLQSQTSAASAPGKSPWNATRRRATLRVLRALQLLLQLQRPSLAIKCLAKAKIPILMARDATSELAIDIGVNRDAFAASDHGRTTSLVRDLQRVLGPAFTALVVVLKEYLHQCGLDKPFTGGLGSYRLYIMAATLFPLEQCSATGRVREAAAATKEPVSVAARLLMFLSVFGNKRRPQFLTATSVLRLPVGGADSCVDFASVFRLDDVVDAFAMAHDILSATMSLGSILFEDRIADDRARARKALPQASALKQTERRRTKR